jgi:flagellin-like hook-associated protein FlgL
MNNSIASLASHLQSAVSDVQARLNTTHNQLASGKKDLSDQDTSIVARLSAQASSQTSVQGNIKNANNIVDVAQSGLSSIASIATKMQDIATQAGNPLNSSEDQAMLNSTFANLNTQIAKIAATSNINGNNLLSDNQTVSVLTESDGINNKTTLIRGVDIASLQTDLNDLSFPETTISTSSTSTVTGTQSEYAQQTVSLYALNTGDSISIGGRTLTAASYLTAAQVAAIFAAKTDAVSPADPSTSLGTFSGSLSSFNGSNSSGSNLLTLTGTSYGSMSAVSVTGIISGAAIANYASDVISEFLSQVTSAQSSLSAATDILDQAYTSSTEVAVSSQKSVDAIEAIDLTALQANLQALSVQQSLDFQVISQMNTAASSLLSIFR